MKSWLTKIYYVGLKKMQGKQKLPLVRVSPPISGSQGEGKP